MMAINGGRAATSLETRLRLERIAGPAFELQRAVQAIQDRIYPRSLRTTIDAQRQLRDAVWPRALSEGLEPLRTALAQQHALGSSFGALADGLRTQERIGGLLPVATLGAQLHGLLGPTLASSAAPFAKLGRGLEQLLPHVAHFQWHDHLVRSLVPTFDLLAMNWDRQVGVLSSMGEPELGGSLSWYRPSVHCLAAAALIPDQPRLPKLTIDVNVTCAFCGDGMIPPELTFSWKGNRKGVIDLSVIPMCPTCMRRGNDDPSYFSEAVDRFAPPRLRIVKPGGSTDGVARGNLHLVWADDIDDDVDHDETE